MEDNAWCQLVSTNDISSEPIKITKSKFIIGRSKVADLSLIGNKLVSGTHCYIEKDKHGKVWLQDTSTNGTLLNYHKKLVGTKEELKHGDEIHLIYKKGEEHLNLSYLFQDVKELLKEEAETTLYSDTDASGTSLTIPEDDEDTDSSLRKRHLEESFEEGDSVASPSEKRPRIDDTPEKTRSATSVDDESSGSVIKRTQSADDSNELIFPIKVSKEDTTNSSGEGSNKPKDEKSISKPETAKSSAKAEAEKRTADDAMEETLICIICQEIMHDCVSCQPCMHSFCGGCYSDWMRRSAECPSCRLKVKQVSKNHMVNSLVEVFLESNPGRKRPEEDIKALDAKNKIKGIVKPKPETTLEESIDNDPHYESVEEEFEDEAEEEDGEEDEDDEEDEYENSEDVDRGLTTALPVGGAGLFGRLAPPVTFPFTGMTGAFGVVRPPRTVCRQCPGHPEAREESPITKAGKAITGALSKMAATVTGGASGDAGEGSSTAPKDENEKIMPKPPTFVCAPAQTHILCSCCLQPMPDRRTEYTRAPTSVPAITCSLCHRAFCHMYWGCRKAECLGCLAKFSDMNFGVKSLDTIVLENTFESDILKNHLKSKDLSVKGFLRDCCENVRSGRMTTLDQVRGFTNDSVVCYACGLRNFREMAYQYRKSLSADDLPPGVTSRPDCYWGKNCRTQKNKIGHSARYNHICEQTKK